MAPVVAAINNANMRRTTVKNTFLELLADGDAEDCAGSVPLRRTNSSPCLRTSSAEVSPDQGPDTESYDSDDDDFFLWEPAGRSLSSLPGPSVLLQVQACFAPPKESLDCRAKRLPGLSDLLQVSSWPAQAGKASPDAVEPAAQPGPPRAQEHTRTPLGKLLTLRGLRAPAVSRTPLSTRAAAYVPSALAAPCWTPAAAPEPTSVPAATAPVAAKAARLGEGPSGVESTTVMLRNLPPSYTRQMLVDLLAKKGLSQHVSFLYLPINFEHSHNVGYAFLNLTCKEQTERLFDVFENFRDWGIESDRVCSVCWSETQGLDANIERYRNSPIMRPQVPDEFKPTLLSNGALLALPRPTRQLRSLRCRKGTSVRTQDSDSCSQ